MSGEKRDLQDLAETVQPPPAGYWLDARGNLIAERNVSMVERDVNDVVLLVHGYGEALSEQMARFREHTLSDVMALCVRIVDEYGGKIGGRKGNITLVSFDGTKRVVLAQAERIAVGPQIIAAQAIIEECIETWSERGNRNLRALVDGAFKSDATGKVSVTQLIRLKNVHIDDARWRSVQAAISDALTPAGKAEYIRLYRRDRAADPWQQVPLNLATVRRSPESESDPRENLIRRAKSAIAEARHCGLAEGDIMAALKEAKRRPVKAAARAGGAEPVADAPAPPAETSQ